MTLTIKISARTAALLWNLEGSPCPASERLPATLANLLWAFAEGHLLHISRDGSLARILEEFKSALESEKSHPRSPEEKLNAAVAEIGCIMHSVKARILTVELHGTRVAYTASPHAPTTGGEHENLLLDCLRWLLNECLVDSGTGVSYWEQFPQFRILCARAGGTDKIIRSQEGEGS